MVLPLDEQILALFRLTRSRIQAVAESHELTYQQLVALRHLLKAGSITMSDLTDRVGVTRGAMTGLVDRLQEAGLVTRRHCETDRRVTFLDLTPRGHEVLDAVQDAWRRETKRWLAKLEPEEREGLSQALGRLLEVGMQGE